MRPMTAGLESLVNSGTMQLTLYARVTLDGGVNDISGGQLLAQGGGRITVVGAAGGGIATLTDGGIVDFKGSATLSTTTNAVFIGSTIEHLILGNSVRFAGSVAGMEAGDTIDLTDIAFAANKAPPIWAT